MQQKSREMRELREHKTIQLYRKQRQLPYEQQWLKKRLSPKKIRKKKKTSFGKNSFGEHLGGGDK